MSQRAEILPRALPPRGLSRLEAAAYIGVSPTLFDMLVKDGRMPEPKRIEVSADGGNGAQLELIQQTKSKTKAKA